ncbi:MAG: hypothetical protein JNK64_24490 [Myxococcales bacterium]|nr:hypothetical protein [Myxococcales bacterium]
MPRQNLARWGAALLVVAAAPAVAEPGARPDRRPVGFTVAVGAGVNVDTPFVEVQLGRRFRCAPHLEAYVDYSYDRPISAFAFHTLGVGVRTRIGGVGPVEVFHQATAALAVSEAGRGPVQDRDLGQRLLGAILTQGVGAATTLPGRWTVALTLTTGTPVWLRPSLDVQRTF